MLNLAHVPVFLARLFQDRFLRCLESIAPKAWLVIGYLDPFATPMPGNKKTFAPAKASSRNSILDFSTAK
jgi:hypothetical protein